MTETEREVVQGRGPAGSGGWLEQACKLIVAIRSGILLVTVLEVAQSDDEQRSLAVVALVVAAVASFVPLRFWGRVGPSLVRHPAYLAAEMVLTAVILLFTGVQSAFVYYTLATALLSGLLYGWAGVVVFSPMLIGVYYWVLETRSDDIPSSFQVMFGQPALYAVVAAAGAGARRMFDRQAEAEARVAAMERQTAAEAERSRLARDMHDSLAKTVSGIGFAALALARRIERDPAGAAGEARRLADDARMATIEARELITGLRGEDGRALPLPVALRMEAERWSAATGVPIALAVEDVGELDAVAARELEWILREALRNVERHAHAGNVQVRLRTLGGRAVLTVADDGDGFDAPDELEDLARGRHFGVAGMRERAQLAGGDLSLESSPGDGCVLSVWVPAPDAERAAPAPPAPRAAPQPAGPAPARPAPPASPAPAPAAADAPGSDTVPRAVPGYTWQ